VIDNLSFSFLLESPSLGDSVLSLTSSVTHILRVTEDSVLSCESQKIVFCHGRIWHTYYYATATNVVKLMIRAIFVSCEHPWTTWLDPKKKETGVWTGCTNYEIVEKLLEAFNLILESPQTLRRLFLTLEVTWPNLRLVGGIGS